MERRFCGAGGASQARVSHPSEPGQPPLLPPDDAQTQYVTRPGADVTVAVSLPCRPAGAMLTYSTSLTPHYFRHTCVFLFDLRNPFKVGLPATLQEPKHLFRASMFTGFLSVLKKKVRSQKFFDDW